MAGQNRINLAWSAATDNVGVAGVQFLLDGAALGAEDTTSPYAVSYARLSAGLMNTPEEVDRAVAEVRWAKEQGCFEGGVLLPGVARLDAQRVGHPLRVEEGTSSRDR